MWMFSSVSLTLSTASIDFVLFVVLNLTFLRGLVGVDGESDLSKARFHPCWSVGSQVIVALRESSSKLGVVFARYFGVERQGVGMSNFCEVKVLVGEEVLRWR